MLAPALGGVIIGHEVARALGVPFRFAERAGERLALRRGFELAPGERVVIIEDVVTTGKSTLETAALAESAGAVVAGIGSIIDRSGGKHGFAVPFAALLPLDLPTYSPDACPLCRDGSEAVKPGSRPQGDVAGLSPAQMDAALCGRACRRSALSASRRPLRGGVLAGDLERPEVVREVVDLDLIGALAGDPRCRRRSAGCPSPRAG